MKEIREKCWTITTGLNHTHSQLVTVKIQLITCRLRSRVATGSTSQPPASDMQELQWDEELAMVAVTRTWVLRHTILDIGHLLLWCPQL